MWRSFTFLLLYVLPPTRCAKSQGRSATPQTVANIRKEWGLTDCISFVVMADRGLTQALTADDHFTQAGFVALLREVP